MAIPNDPLLANQWHLRSLNLYSTAPGNPSVWDEYTGAGVNIGVYDNGVQQTHFDLNDNYNPALEYTGPGAVANTNAAAVGEHGTAVAGLIAAEANGLDTVGVAHGANVTGVTMWTATNAHWTNAFFTGVMAHQANFDIVNHSWGASALNANWEVNDTWYQIVSNGLANAAANGRDGLGTIIVSAAGNDRHDTNQWGVASDVSINAAHVGSRYSITVAGYGQDGFVSDYSNPGANILVSAPARGLWVGAPAGSGILATDKIDDGTPGFTEGPDGFQAGNVVNDLRGTSFAAPLVSGVVALMLEANPNLGWRDVKEILAATAVHLGTPQGQPASGGSEFHEWFTNGARDWNGGGHNFSEDYGFGGVDALAAVRLAESWTEQKTSANEMSPGASFGTFPADIIPDNNSAGLLYQFNMSAGVDVESVVFDLNMTHTWAEDLWIRVASPSGTEVTLLMLAGGSNDVNGLRLATNAFLGESSEGTWSIRIADIDAGVTGSLSGISFSLFGSQDTENDTFIYTNSYASLAAADVWRTYLDGHGGRDLLNAAAVTGSSTIDLRGTATGAGGDSFIAGTVLHILGGIEDAVTGDGDDVIIGSEDANWLRGMRGADQLEGRGGNDSLYGGVGADRLYAGALHDLVVGEAGLDVILGEEGNDTLNGGFTNYLDSRGRDGNDIVSAGNGNDVIIASLENDNVDGGLGIDMLSFAWTSSGVDVNLALGSTTFWASGGWTDPDGLGGGAWGRFNTTPSPKSRISPAASAPIRCAATRRPTR